MQVQWPPGRVGSTLSGTPATPRSTSPLSPAYPSTSPPPGSHSSSICMSWLASFLSDFGRFNKLSNKKFKLCKYVSYSTLQYILAKQPCIKYYQNNPEIHVNKTILQYILAKQPCNIYYQNNPAVHISKTTLQYLIAKQPCCKYQENNPAVHISITILQYILGKQSIFQNLKIIHWQINEFKL